jgi:hypothetical protein
VVGDDEKVPPMYIHDRNNPQIEVAATFPDSKSFKVALRQLAIREDWAIITEHSDTKRFNGRCTDQDCPWKIHAYKIKNASTFMVCLRYFMHCFLFFYIVLLSCYGVLELNCLQLIVYLR